MYTLERLNALKEEQRHIKSLLENKLSLKEKIDRLHRECCETKSKIGVLSIQIDSLERERGRGLELEKFAPISSAWIVEDTDKQLKPLRQQKANLMAIMEETIILIKQLEEQSYPLRDIHLVSFEVTQTVNKIIAYRERNKEKRIIRKQQKKKQLLDNPIKFLSKVDEIRRMYINYASLHNIRYNDDKSLIERCNGRRAKVLSKSLKKTDQAFFCNLARDRFREDFETMVKDPSPFNILSKKL